MKTKMLCGLGLFALLLGGCVVQSIHPLFTEREYIPAPEIVGTWTPREDKEPKEIYAFAEDGKQYKLAHTDDKGHKATFHVAAGRLGPNTFLDFSPDDPLPGSELNSAMMVHLIPAHVFAKLVKTNDDLVLVVMDIEWLKNHLQKNPKAIAHTIRDEDWPILTAPTEDLKKFVAKYADDTNAFKFANVLMAKKPGK